VINGIDHTLPATNISELKSLEIMEINLEREGTSYNFKPGPVKVTQCGLWYCQQLFDVNVSLGLQTQQMTQGTSAHFYKFPTRVAQSFPSTSDRVEFIISISNDVLDISQYISGEGSTWDMEATDSIGVQVWRRVHSERDSWISRVAKSLSNELRPQNQVPMVCYTYVGRNLKAG
jgi:hypothetical protein